MDENKISMEIPLYDAIQKVKDEVHEACEYAMDGDDKMAYKELMDAVEMAKQILQKSPYSGEQVMSYYERMKEDPSHPVNNRARRMGYRNDVDGFFRYPMWPLMRHRGRDGRYVSGEYDYPMPHGERDSYPHMGERHPQDNRGYDGYENEVYDRRGRRR